MKFLFRKIAPKYFVFSQIAILILGLFFLFGIHYIVNIQYQTKARPFANGPVTTPPKSFALDLSEPVDNSLVFEPKVLVSGKTSPSSELLLVINNTHVVAKSDSEGNFSQSVELTEGPNTISVVVFDESGDFREGKRMVFYSEEELEWEE